MSWAQAIGKATVANIGCGFDILGFSVDGLADIVTIHRCSDFQGVKLTVQNNNKLPEEPEKNTAGFAVIEYLKQFHLKNEGLLIKLDKHLPLGSGMGSSAASSAAALLAVNALYGLATQDELFRIGLKCEQLACGSGHGDNIAPSLYGGVTLIQHTDPMKVIPLPIPEELYCLLIHPEVEVNTQTARDILPEKVPLALAVKQWSNIGTLVTGFCLKDKTLIKSALSDYLIEKHRASLIPLFDKLREIAKINRSFNLSISGSGPTVFSFSDNPNHLQAQQDDTEHFLKSKGVQCQCYLSQLNEKGSTLLHLEE